LTVIEKPIKEIHPYGRNPRRNDGAVDAVAESIREFGWRVPIVIDSKGVVVAGHTRLKAAKKLKMKTVPCVIADDLTEEQIKAYRLADNKTGELATWDFPALKLELAEIKLDMPKFGFDFSLPGYPASRPEDLEPYRPEPEPDNQQNAPPVTVSEDDFTDSFTLPDGDRRPIQEINFTLSDDEAETVKEAIRIMKRSDAFKDYENPLNQNSNGNALFLVVSEWLAQRI